MESQSKMIYLWDLIPKIDTESDRVKLYNLLDTQPQPEIFVSNISSQT